MAITETLYHRSNGHCELCESLSEEFLAFTVPLRAGDRDENRVVLCAKCDELIAAQDFRDEDYWRFLTGSIWSGEPAVKVLSYKILGKLINSSWAIEAKESAYLTDEELLWANSEDAAIAEQVIHKDAYGVVLQNGDNVFLTESLNVKGTNFTASKGTKVSKIRLVHDNAEHIEGKIEGSTIVIVSKFVRKG